MDIIWGHWQPYNTMTTNQLRPHSGQSHQIFHLPQMADIKTFQLQKYVFLSIFQTFSTVNFTPPSKLFSRLEAHFQNVTDKTITRCLIFPIQAQKFSTSQRLFLPIFEHKKSGKISHFLIPYLDVFTTLLRYLEQRKQREI